MLQKTSWQIIITVLHVIVDYLDEVACVTHIEKGEIGAILHLGGNMGEDVMDIVIGIEVVAKHEGGIVASTVLTTRDAYDEVEKAASSSFVKAAMSRTWCSMFSLPVDGNINDGAIRVHELEVQQW